VLASLERVISNLKFQINDLELTFSFTFAFTFRFSCLFLYRFHFHLAQHRSEVFSDAMSHLHLSGIHFPLT